MKKEIFGLTPEELQQEFVAAGLKKFRASQVYQWLYKKCIFKFEEMHNLSKADIAVLNEKFTVMPANINILTRWKSSDGLTEKLLLELQDGNSVETVLMHHDYGYSVCVSSQVGCAMACAFCASGLNGCVRNLTSAEIIMQVYLFNAMIAPQQVSRVVVMGSGEPMLNYDEVTGALKFLHREDTAFMSYRNMTVSTCGIIPGIERLAEENIPIIGHLIGNVAISVTNYFYQQELQELATTEVAQKFAELRQSGINIEIDIFQRALSNYVLNDGIDLSLIMNLQGIINERLEVHNFLKSIIESSDLEYNIIDDGNIIPKLNTRINFNK